MLSLLVHWECDMGWAFRWMFLFVKLNSWITLAKPTGKRICVDMRAYVGRHTVRNVIA